MTTVVLEGGTETQSRMVAVESEPQLAVKGHRWANSPP